MVPQAWWPCSHQLNYNSGGVTILSTKEVTHFCILILARTLFSPQKTVPRLPLPWWLNSSIFTYETNKNNTLKAGWRTWRILNLLRWDIRKFGSKERKWPNSQSSRWFWLFMDCLFIYVYQKEIIFRKPVICFLR